MSANPKSDPATPADFAAMDEILGLEPAQDTPAVEAPEPESMEEIPEAPEAPEPQEEEVVEPPEEEQPPHDPEDAAEEEKLLAGKYKSPEELERAYEELQSLQGKQSSELGELRKLVEERLPEPEEERFDFSQPNMDAFDELIEDNPQQAAQWALENDSSGRLFQRAMSNWFEIPGQAVFAANYLTDLKLAQARAEFSQQTAPLQEQADKQAIATAWTQLQADIPDLDKFADAIMAEAKESPEILRGAETVEQKRSAFHKLYRLAKSAQDMNLETAQAQAREQEAVASKKAKMTGSVATQTTVADAETVDQNEAWLQENFDKFLPRQ